jgi:NADH:ubiquinone oxidoreductase subunit 4 (subunit M)
MFIAEILFFTFLIDLFPLLYCFFIVLLYLLAPTFVLRTWMNVLFGTSSYSYKTLPSDLSSKEFFTYGLLIAIMFWFGVS